MIIGNKTFSDGTHIMGIINLTPDSFYEKSRVNENELLKHAEKMVKDGAEVLDLGAQSTRPNYVAVSADEEIRRLLPALTLLKKELGTPVSVDTNKFKVAQFALENGADMINDIYGLQGKESADGTVELSDDCAFKECCLENNCRFANNEFNSKLFKSNLKDDNSNETISLCNFTACKKEEKSSVRIIAELAAKHNAAVCIMHNAKSNKYSTMFSEIRTFFEKSLCLAKNAGIDFNKILLDGGIGFAKDKKQNFELLNNYEKIIVSSLPLLLGTSRKSMFGGLAQDRLEATLNSTRLAVRKNILFVRVHDIIENKKAIEEETEKIFLEKTII